MSLWLQENEVIRYFVGYFVSLIIGHFITGWCVNRLWTNVPKEAGAPSIQPPRLISFWQGVAERFLYTSTICLGKPEFVAVWLAFKAVIRWRVDWKPDQQDRRHISGGPIYMIGTILSLTFGYIGAAISSWTWNPWIQTEKFVSIIQSCLK